MRDDESQRHYRLVKEHVERMSDSSSLPISSLRGRSSLAALHLIIDLFQDVAWAVWRFGRR